MYTVTVLTSVPILQPTYDSLLHPKRPHNHWLRHTPDFRVHSYGSYFSTDSITYDSLLHPKRPHNHWLRHTPDFCVHSYGSYFSTDSITYDSLLHPKRPHNHWLHHTPDFRVHSYGSYFSTDSTTNLRQPSSSEASTQSLTASHTRLPCTQLRFLLQYWFYNKLTTAFFIWSVHTIIDCITHPTSVYTVTVLTSVLILQLMTAFFIRSVHTIIDCVTHPTSVYTVTVLTSVPILQLTTAFFIRSVHTIIDCVTHPTSVYTVTVLTSVPILQPTYDSLLHPKRPHNHWLRHTPDFCVHSYGSYFSTDSTTNLRQPSSSEASTQSLTASHTRLPCTQLRFLLQYRFYNQLTTAFFIRSVHTIIDCVTHPTSVYTVAVPTSILVWWTGLWFWSTFLKRKKTFHTIARAA